MAQETLLVVVIVLVSAGASFFFALAETALFSLGKWQTRQLEEKSPARGGIVNRLLARSEDLLATMVLGNTFANASMLTIALWMALTGRWYFWPTVAGLLGVTLFGCEVLPKTLAVRQPETWALQVSLPTTDGGTARTDQTPESTPHMPLNASDLLNYWCGPLFLDQTLDKPI